VLGIGSTPGITNLLARIAADQLDPVERLDVRIGAGDFRPGGAPFIPPYSIRTIFDECTLPPMVYRNGRWSAVAPLSGPEEILFPDPVGRATAVYTLHSEVALFPVAFRERGLRHASFKIAFPMRFLAQLEVLVNVGLAGTDPVTVQTANRDESVSIVPREIFAAILAGRGMPEGAATAPDDCDVLRVVAQGARDGAAVELIEEMVVRPYKPWQVAAGDIDTGVPLAIAGILLASGAAERTGVHGAERVFDPRAFLRELAHFDLHAHETVTQAIS
jgi:lysine 6-dehydrogenase